MGLKTVRVYKNTGFNGIDIPGTPSVLENSQYTDYPDFYYLREDIDLPVIRIKDTYDNLKDVDYVRITDTTDQKNYYYFASPKAISRGVTAVALSLDALLTMGGASAQNYISGWMVRGHIPKDEDYLFGNTAPEEFVPSRPLIVDKWQILPTTNPNTNDTDIIISNTDILDAAGTDELTAEVISGIVDGSIDPVMYLPKLKWAPLGTNFRVWDFDDEANHDFTLTGTAAYDAQKADVIRGLSKLYSFGQLQLGGSYQIPAEWLSSKAETTTGLISQLIGWHEIIDLTGAPYEYIDTIKNKKAIAMYRTAHLLSLASGDAAAYPIAETAGTGENGLPRANPRIRTWADPSSTGKPYAGFADLHTGGGTGTGIQHAYADSVHGAQWSNSQIVVEGASGNAWSSLSAAMARAAQSRAYEQGILQNSMAQKNAQMGYEEASLARDKFNNVGMFQSAAGLFGSLGNSAAGIASGAALGSAVGPVGTIAGGFIGGLSGFAGALDVPYDYNITEAQTRNALTRAEYQMAANSASLDLINRARAQEINESTISELRANSVVAPSVMFTPEINLGLYGYNKFGYYETCMHPEDVLEADRYFQRYGYTGLHKPLSAAAINSRQYYNYVQATGINIKGTGYGMRIRERAIAQLNAGVRIWHVLPDAQYYEVN